LIFGISIQYCPWFTFFSGHFAAYLINCSELRQFFSEVDTTVPSYALLDPVNELGDARVNSGFVWFSAAAAEADDAV